MEFSGFSSNMTETSLQNLMKEIGEAVKLDDESNEKDAYITYTLCIYKIASNLLLSIKGSQCNLVVTPNVSRQVKLLQRCVERVSSLMEKMEKDQGEAEKQMMLISRSQPGSISNRQGNTAIQPNPVHSTPTSSPVHQLTQGHSGIGQDMSQVGPNPHPIHVTVPALPPENNPHIFNKVRVLTPMEKAIAQNKSLLIAYKARMERLNKSNFSAYSYSLSMQRKMTENLEIAKAQEVELAKKMKARQERLEEAAARRFTHPSGMSEEEKEMKEIYKNILTYENDVTWLSEWRHKLAANREDPITICQLVQEILRCSDHPFTEMLRAFQFKMYEQLYPLVVNKHPEVDLIKVDLPEDLWPSAEDVADILSAFVRKTPEPRRRRRIRSRGRNSESNGESVYSSQASTTDTEIQNDDKGKDDLVKDETNITTTKDDLFEKTSIETRQEYEIDNKRKDKNPKDNVITDVLNDEMGGQKSSSEGKICEIESDIGAGTGSENVTTGLSVAPEEDSGGEERDLENSLVSVVSYTQGQLREAYAKGQQLESELTVQRKQARMLMQQIYQDNGDFEQENFDDLFDDDDESDDNDNKTNYGSDNKESEHTTSSQVSNAKDIVGDSNRLIRSSSSHPVPRFSHEEQPEEMYTSLPPMGNLPDDREILAARKDEQERLSKMKLDAYDRHLAAVCKEIHCQLDKLLRVMIVAYEVLDTPVGKDQCAVALEEPYFKPVWKTLLRLFRVVHHRRETILACVMTSHKTANPETMKINPKFQLASPSSLGKPYQEAIEELLRLPHYYTVPCKVDCVVKVCRLICECVDKFYSNQQSVMDDGQAAKKKDPPALGADDLLPILTYVIIHCQCPQLVSECQAMSEFIAEGYMMGEEGYCLTTFRTAVEYLVSLYKPPQQSKRPS